VRFEVGAPVRVEFTKWGGLPHWVFGGVYLGSDDHGDWLGHVAGTRIVRPGKDVVVDSPWVTLAPADGSPWIGSFNGPGHHLEVYVDIATAPVWQGSSVRAVDLDLDVVWARDEPSPRIVDQDEFEEHQVALGYPTGVVAMAAEAAPAVLAAVGERRPPFDGSADRWLSRLSRVGSS
jgi:hypothetical protein